MGLREGQWPELSRKAGPSALTLQPLMPPTHQRFSDAPNSCDVPSTQSTPTKSCISVDHPTPESRHTTHDSGIDPVSRG